MPLLKKSLNTATYQTTWISPHAERTIMNHAMPFRRTIIVRSHGYAATGII